VELVVLIFGLFGNEGSNCSMKFSNPIKLVHGAILSHTAGSAFRMDRRTSDRESGSSKIQRCWVN